MICLVSRSKVLSLIHSHFRTMNYSGTFNCAGDFTQSFTCLSYLKFVGDYQTLLIGRLGAAWTQMPYPYFAKSFSQCIKDCSVQRLAVLMDRFRTSVGHSGISFWSLFTRCRNSYHCSIFYGDWFHLNVNVFDWALSIPFLFIYRLSLICWRQQRVCRHQFTDWQWMRD